MRILVTGSTGFIAGRLIPELLKMHHQVICLVRSQSKADSLMAKYSNANIECICGDVTILESLSALPLNVDCVIHMAAMGHVSATSQEAYEQFTSINEGGTKNLVNYYLKSNTLKKFIHFSSTAAMGPASTPILDETTLPHPLTPYQKSKLRSEFIPIKAYQENQFPALILRPCMVYGIGGYGEFYKFCKLMKKGVFPRVGHGLNLTPLVHVDDVVQATVLAFEHGVPGETYIVASEKSIAMDELHHLIMSNMGIQAPYIYCPACIALAGAKVLESAFNLIGKEPIVTYRNIKSTITDRTFDISKARTQLGYHACIEFKDGIRETVEWYKNMNAL